RNRLVLCNLPHQTLGIRMCSIFFFQAEDGIRYFHVTGVQTCALPIYFCICAHPSMSCSFGPARKYKNAKHDQTGASHHRSEERRVGKECTTRRSPERRTKKW